MELKFETVAEKTAKNFRGLLYFAAPGRLGIGDRVSYSVRVSYGGPAPCQDAVGLQLVEQLAVRQVYCATDRLGGVLVQTSIVF